MAGLPEALRVGTPVHERGQSPYQEFLSESQRSTQSSQTSDRYSDRRASLHSIGSIRTTKPRYSYAEPQNITHNGSYQSPDLPGLPPLPTFDSPISYEPTFNPFAPQGTQHSKPVRKRSLLSKIGSISSRRSGSRYGALAEDEEHGSRRGSGPKELKSLDEGEEEDIGIDLSSFESPITVHGFGPKWDNVTTREVEEGEGDSALGGGMNSVLSASVAMPGQRNHRRGASVMDQETRIEAQRVAEKRGEILAVAEVPEFDDAASIADISSISGGDPLRRNTASYVDGEEGGKKSYFFPVDPEQPAWRPHQMRWPYMTMLVVIALGLAGLQEYLCQLSIKRAKNHDGLLKFTNPKELSLVSYFAWKYMPTLILVTYGVLWQVVDFEVKRLEPYYQLSKRSGSTAKDSLNQDYLTFLSYLVPLKAVRAKQWAVVYSSIATLMAGSIVPVLQSAAVVMLPVKAQRVDGEPKFVLMSPVWSRAMSAVLLCVALYGILLMIQLRRKSGLLSDPKGIAGIASMATKSHILNDFKDLDVAPNHIIHNQLRTRRYNLHKSSLWQGEYIKQEEKVQHVKEENPHPILLRLQAGVPFIGYIIAFGVLIPSFMFIGNANIVTEKIPWLLTAIATGVKLGWGCLDMNLRVIEPYYILSRRNAPPRTLVMDYTGTVPGWFSILACMNGQYLLALVGLGSILSEILTVCVTSFSVDGRKFIAGQGGNGGDEDRSNTSETFRSFWISFALAMGIIIYLVVVGCFVYAQRRHKFLPRQPGTIAGVLAFIHQSRMLTDFIDTERMDSKAMRQHLESLGKTYALGWFNGRDGEDHCGVDQEPMLAPYIFGVDWRKSRVLGNQVGNWENF